MSEANQLLVAIEFHSMEKKKIDVEILQSIFFCV